MIKLPKKQNWINRKRDERAARAVARQLEYQQDKAEKLRGSEKAVLLNLMNRAAKIRRLLAETRSFRGDEQILEVGSGAHGLIFGLGLPAAIGIDPLAVEYKRLFPLIQRKIPTVAALGEQLPFADNSFEVVLSDNVIDHAREPLQIVTEIIRVLKPGGVLYFSVNIHHPLYSLGSSLHGAWNAVGLKYELSPFADHTVHLTLKEMQRVFAALPLDITLERNSVAATKTNLRNNRGTSLENKLKRFFFKNALFEIVAVKR